MRSRQGVVRGRPLSLQIDGRVIEAYEGETLAAAMLAADARVFRRDTQDRPRGLFCNMGVCSECLVDVTQAGQPTRRLRACVTDVQADMVVSTTRAET
ncbi:2Fe-2S iron-sulfur cluster-binding protein [Brevundimonas nasdae]|uniref:2Fe-2S iron-sulfur cluster-binding protein n=1 Tax=Brevundimonas nasdae TaxID=172043 RepID=UPI003F68CB38